MNHLIYARQAKYKTRRCESTTTCGKCTKYIELNANQVMTFTFIWINLSISTKFIKLRANQG